MSAEAIDPLVIGAEIVLALQTIVARSVGPQHPPRTLSSLRRR